MNDINFTKSQLEMLKQILTYPNDFKYPLGTKIVSDDPEFINKQGLGGGWDKVEGAFIFGANDSYPADGVVRGSAKVFLSKNQIPAHNHNNGISSLNCGDAPVGFGSATGGSNYAQLINTTLSGSANIYNWANVVTDGGYEPHENMPPYIAKYMWIKTKLESETNGLLEVYV